MAAEADTDALAERVYVAMVGEEAWRRLPEEVKVFRRAEGVAFKSDVILGLSPPFQWDDLTVPSLFGVGLQTWPFAQEAATRLAESAGAELFTIAGAAHTAHVSHPEDFATFVRRSVALA
jgi:pimeloyl-ACP methyl ester carboxylesterase